MHPQLTLIAAQQHIADLHRAADHNRLVHTATRHQQPRRPRTPPRRRRASLVPALAPPPPGFNVSVARKCFLEGGQPHARGRSRPDRQQRYRLRRQAAGRGPPPVAAAFLALRSSGAADSGPLLCRLSESACEAATKQRA